MLGKFFFWFWTWPQCGSHIIDEEFDTQTNDEPNRNVIAI